MKSPPGKDGDPERSILDHLDELRRRLFLSGAAAIAGAVGAALAFQPVVDTVAGQLREAYAAAGHPEDFNAALVSLTPTDVASLVFKFSLVGGLFLALPLLLFQLWGFLSPALRAQERRLAAWLLTAGP